MNLKHTCTNSISELEAAKKELLTAASNTDTFLSWMDTSPLVFYDISDKSKQYPKNIEQAMNEYKTVLGHRPDAEFAASFLDFYIEGKNEFKNTARHLDKLKWTKGAKYTKEYLASTSKDVEIRDEILRKNAKDVNLFQNFKLCGDQLVLIEGNDCELMKEDLQGRIAIDNSYWLPNKIASRVEKLFQDKIRIYYNKFADFLATLDTKDIDIDIDHDVVETPIEDFIQTELPTTFLNYYTIKAVYINWVDNKGLNHKQLDHYELKRNNKIPCFNDIFKWTLENWKLFKHCIQGQDEFLAWSNNPNEVAVSHWVPEEVKTMPKPWQEFLEEKMPNNKHFQMRLVTYLGMCIDAKNSSQQYLIISDQGGTGKGVMMRALEYALPKNSISSIDSTALSDSNEFGLAGIKIWNTHISVMEEYADGNMQSNKAKKLIANNPMDLNVKGKAHIHWEPINHKFIVFSNKKATIKEYANRRRAIPLTFVGKYAWTEEKQKALNETAKDFLNFCYTVYKKCPLFINNFYYVLSEADENEFLKTGVQSSIDPDTLSKHAFNEDSLKQYFNTDEYTDSDDYIDFENFFKDAFIEDADGELSDQELSVYILKKLSDDTYDEYREAFSMNRVKDVWVLSTRSKGWWKWQNYLKEQRGFEFKNRPNYKGYRRKVWKGFSPKEFA